MKKYIGLCCVVVMLFGLIMFTLPAADGGGPDTTYNGNEGGGGSGCSCSTWDKTSNKCPNDETKTEYHCATGGDQQCTVQNCP